MTGRLLPSGEQAVLVEVDSLDEVLALHRRLWVDGPAARAASTPSPGLARCCWSPTRPARWPRSAPRPRSLLPRVRRSPSWLAGAAPQSPTNGPAVTFAVVEVPVHYDGPDLADVAELTGLSAPTRSWPPTPGGCGWWASPGSRPGSPTSSTATRGCDVPRRATPRTRVPAGLGRPGRASSAASTRAPPPAAGSCIGHTDQVLWDLDRDPPALLRPGLRVRFVDARRRDR